MTNPPTTLTAGNTVVIFQKLFFEPHTILRGCIECMLPVYALIVLTDIKTQTTRLRWLRRRLKPAHRRTIAELRPFRRLRPKIIATLRIAALARSRHHTGSLTARPSRAGSVQHRARFHGQDVEVFLHPPYRVRRALHQNRQHSYQPPEQQSLNHCEKFIQQSTEKQRHPPIPSEQQSRHDDSPAFVTFSRAFEAVAAFLSVTSSIATSAGGAPVIVALTHTRFAAPIRSRLLSLSLRKMLL